MLSSVDPEPGEQHRRRRIAGELAADADPAPVAPRPPSTVARDRARSTAGCGPASRAASARVAALGGQRVLGQVVGADREEVDVRRGASAAVSAAAGTSTMIPTSSGASMPVRGPRRVEQRARGAALAERRHHREHHLDRVLGRGAQDRAQLGPEQLRARRARGGCRAGPGTGWPRAAAAATGSGLSAPTSSVRTTSGRPSERARRSRAASRPARPRRAAARGRGRGTRCAAGRRPRRPARPPPRPRRPSRCWRRPRRARRRAWRPARARARARAARRAAAALAALLGVAQLVGGGSTRSVPGVAVEQQRRALLDREHARRRGRPRPACRARARGSRRARSRAPRAVAMPRTSAGSRPAASAGVSSPATTMPGSAAAGAPRSPVSAPTHAAADVEDVGGALAQERVVEAR